MFAEFRDPESLELAAAFSEMSSEERGHGTTVRKRYFDRYGTHACAVTEEDISDFIELPRLEDGRVFAIDELKAGRSLKTMALEIAAAAEDNALRFYPVWRRAARTRSFARSTGNSSISKPNTPAGWGRSLLRADKR
jgi:hypothetical protein